NHQRADSDVHRPAPRIARVADRLTNATHDRIAEMRQRELVRGGLTGVDAVEVAAETEAKPSTGTGQVCFEQAVCRAVLEYGWRGDLTHGMRVGAVRMTVRIGRQPIRRLFTGHAIECRIK